MADTLPNIIVPRLEVVDIYAESGISTGTKIAVKMIGNGEGRLYSGATLTGRPDDSTGYHPIYPKEELFNNAGDSGAFIWSDQGCTINAQEA